MGPWFLPLNYCDSEHVLEKISGICLVYPPWLLCVRALYTMERKNLSQHPCHFDINLALYNLEIYWIELQPGLAETTTLITLPIKNFAPSERRPARWLKALLQSQSLKFVVSVQLEPKMAILQCCDFRWPAA